MKILITQKYPVLELYTRKGLKILSLKSILYVKATKQGSEIYLKNSKIVQTGYLLRDYSHYLPEPYYFRCHNSYIVNCQFVDCFCNNQITLTNNIRIPLSRRRRKEFEKNLIELQQNS
jgi:two-component system LytT family response regulator